MRETAERARWPVVRLTGHHFHHLAQPEEVAAALRTVVARLTEAR
jgi:hypothetical protein